MQPVLTSKKVKQAEQLWATEHAGSTWPLMVKAAESFYKQFGPKLNKGKGLVVVGIGNNGGDGYYLGKLLIEAGCKFTLCAPLGLPKPGIDAEQAHAAFKGAGGVAQEQIPESSFDWVVDALFGSGLDRPLSEDVVSIIRQINALDAVRYSVDVPSGLNADSGLPIPISINADATHSFIAYKPGLLTGEGTGTVGRLSLDTLGVSVSEEWKFKADLEELPERKGNTHKAQHGNVRVLGGRLNMGGAAIIAAKSSLASGAGRVFVHCAEQFFTAVVAQCPELMTANDWSADENQQDIYVVGPGLGRDDEAKYILGSVIEGQRSRGVLDADALYHLSRDPKPVPNWILTPHEAEAARLLDWETTRVLTARVEAAQRLAEKFQSVVVLKGAGTLVADQSSVVFCHRGAPAMATPGMGDCLAGMIGSLLAQGLSAKEAAITAVNWNAAIGDQLAQSQRIVLATDVIDQLKLR